MIFVFVDLSAYDYFSMPEYRQTILHYLHYFPLLIDTQAKYSTLYPIYMLLITFLKNDAVQKYHHEKKPNLFHHFMVFQLQ